MNVPTPTPKYALKFIYVGSEKGKVEFDIEYTVPAVQAMPQVGDEVKLPVEVTNKAGFERNAFKVKGRLFIIGQMPPAITGLIYLQVE